MKTEKVLEKENPPSTNIIGWQARQCGAVGLEAQQLQACISRCIGSVGSPDLHQGRLLATAARSHRVLATCLRPKLGKT